MRNRPQRNNNPLNIRWAKQREAVGPDKDGYAVFLIPEAGWRAAHHQIKIDADRGMDITQFIYKFAPPTENETDDYLTYVCRVMKCTILTPLAEISPYAIAGAMAQYEGYYAT